MKILFSAVTSCRQLALGGLFFLIALAVFLVSGSVDKNVFAFEKGSESSPIQIKSDSLVARNDANYAEFIGNVSTAQGTTLITSERLKIFFGSEPDQKRKKDNPQESIKKVVASQNVVIRMENRTAYTAEAEYTPSSKIIVLSGPNSRVVSGNNYVIGEKITVYVNEDRVVVERSKEKQVEAVFYQAEPEKKP